MLNLSSLNKKRENSVSLQSFTDAAGTYGFGAVFGVQWCYGEWPGEWKGQNIVILEFYPIVLSLLLWGDKIRDKCLTIFTDNEALVHVINRSTCKDTTLMSFVRKLLLVCLRQNIYSKQSMFQVSRTPLQMHCLVCRFHVSRR